jgi:hypothetical protein
MAAVRGGRRMRPKPHVREVTAPRTAAEQGRVDSPCIAKPAEGLRCLFCLRVWGSWHIAGNAINADH